MTSSRLLVVFALLGSALGCQSEAPSDNLAVGAETIAAKILEQGPGVDGGTGGNPPTIVVTNTTTSTAYGTQTWTSLGSSTYTTYGTQTWTSYGTNTWTSLGTVSSTALGTGTVTKTTTVTSTQTVTNASSATVTGTVSGTWTVTAWSTGSWTGANTKTQTTTNVSPAQKPTTSSVTATKTTTDNSGYNPGVTKTATGTVTQFATRSGATTVTMTDTATGTVHYSGSGTRTVSGTASNTGLATASWSHLQTSTTTSTAHNTLTVYNTLTNSNTVTSSNTLTKTNTVTNSNTVTSTSTSTATATNPCYGTWSFCDNFETGSGAGWNVRQGPVQNFSVGSDGTKVYSQSDSTASQLYISQGGSAWMDSTIEASLKPTRFSSSTSAATVTLWGHYDSTWGADCGYYVALRGDGKVALGKRVAGVDSALGSPVAVSGGIAAGTWYDVKLEFVGTTIKAYVGETLLLTQADTSCDAGSVGVGSVGASFEADDVRVTAPATNACVQDWRNTTCGAFCTYEAGVQSDRAGCGAYLDCYATHGCSPETCGGQDDVCGVNRPGLNTWGTASKEVADQVFKCLGCAGSVDCAKAKYYNGTVCADGNPCTWGDTCQNKVCVPDPNRNTQCSASDQCHDVGTCDTGTGVCSNPTKADGTGCDDGNACTQNDTCNVGTCAPGTAVTCGAIDQCHDDGICDPATGLCSNPEKTGTACDDGDPCTRNDVCSAGICQPGDPVVCVATDQCHSAGVCDPAAGGCSNPILPDGTACSDGDACTQDDSCHVGTCGGAAVDCGLDGTCIDHGTSYSCGLCLNTSSPTCQTTFYKDSDFKGSSITLGIGDYTSPDQFNPPGSAISSLQVGQSVRVAMRNASFFEFGRTAFFNSSNWSYVGDDVNDSTGAIKVFPALGGPMATWFRGNYPSEDTAWSDDVQGLAHDDQNWYITQKSKLWKWPLTADLDSNDDNKPAVGIPSVLTAKGYDHFGDLDQYGGFLFVPLQNGSDGPLVAAFRTSDLSLVATSTFPDSGSLSGLASYVAIRKQTTCASELNRVTLVASGDLDPTHPFVEYEVDMSAVTAGQNGFLKPNPRQITLQALDPMVDEDHLGASLTTTQGAAFSPDGRLLYLLTGYCGIGSYISVLFMDTCGIASTSTAIPQARSSSGYGPFDFEKHSGDGCDPWDSCACIINSAEEPEGLDYFDVTQSSVTIPGVTGQVHALLIANDAGDDQVWLKHYSF